MLNCQNITMTQPTKKLDHKWLGPYPVEKVILWSAYCLKLPCQGLSNPTPTYRPTLIYRQSLGNHQPIRPELRSSGRSRFPIHTLRAFIQTPLGQVRPSSYIVPLTQ